MFYEYMASIFLISYEAWLIFAVVGDVPEKCLFPPETCLEFYFQLLYELFILLLITIYPGTSYFLHIMLLVYSK